MAKEEYRRIENFHPDAPTTYKIFKLPSTEIDNYLICVKNELKDYFKIANSAVFLPPEERKSIEEYIKRIDIFIKNDLLDNVKKALEFDEKKHNLNYEISDRGQDKIISRVLVAKYFMLMTYANFKASEELRQDRKKIYTDISLADTLPMDSVTFKSLKEKLYSSFETFKMLAENEYFINYKDVDTALLAASHGHWMPYLYDVSTNRFLLAVLPHNEDQAKQIMKAFESNWEQEPDGYNENRVIWGTHEGVPSLTFRIDEKIIDGKPCYIPIAFAIKPTPECEGYICEISYKDIPEEFIQVLNSEPMQNWINEQKNKSFSNGSSSH